MLPSYVHHDWVPSNPTAPDEQVVHLACLNKSFRAACAAHPAEFMSAAASRGLYQVCEWGGEPTPARIGELLAQRADPNWVDRYGTTPSVVLSTNNAVLLQWGADGRADRRAARAARRPQLGPAW